MNVRHLCLMMWHWFIHFHFSVDMCIHSCSNRKKNMRNKLMENIYIHKSDYKWWWYSWQFIILSFSLALAVSFHSRSYHCCCCYAVCLQFFNPLIGVSHTITVHPLIQVWDIAIHLHSVCLFINLHWLITFFFSGA